MIITYLEKSDKEMTIWGTLVVTIGLLSYYLLGINSLQAAGALSQETMVSYLYRVVVVAVILEIIMQSVLAGIKHKEADTDWKPCRCSARYSDIKNALGDAAFCTSRYSQRYVSSDGR